MKVLRTATEDSLHEAKEQRAFSRAAKMSACDKPSGFADLRKRFTSMKFFELEVLASAVADWGQIAKATD